MAESVPKGQSTGTGVLGGSQRSSDFQISPNQIVPDIRVRSVGPFSEGSNPFPGCGIGGVESWPGLVERTRGLLFISLR